METLVPIVEFQNYADKVITYHQYKDALDLTQTEAKTHPDTLEAFGDIYETVEACPELRAAYTGVLRCRGRNRAEAIDKVRTVEKDIIASLYDLEVIGESKYYKEREGLGEDTEIRKRAEQFVRIFKKAIPVEQLPKKRQRHRRRSAKPEGLNQTTIPDAGYHTPSIEGLRQGQEPALEAMFDYVERKGIENAEGHLIAPTGSGKTVLVSKFLERLRQEERLPTTVIVVPTAHLKIQTLQELKDKGFKGRVQLHESGKKHDPRAEVIIITQQGFARQLSAGGSSLDAERTGLVIFDEAHHIGGERTKEVINAKLPHAGIIGVTASPDYDAKRKLAHHLPDLIHEITNDEAVEWGLIAPYQTILLPTHGDMSFVVPSGKDYHQYMLEKATNTSPRNHLIARFLVDNFLDQLVIANVNTVKHAEALAEIMRGYGKDTLAVSGSTKNLEQVLNGFREREITGLVHAKVIGEGVDLVPVEVVANVASTLSEVREKQRVGRGQRVDPNNPDKVLKVVECVDDHYVRKPILYGTLTGRWLYRGEREIVPFEPAPGYRVLQTPEEIEAWWSGEMSLPHSDREEFTMRENSYQPVEAKLFGKDGDVIDLGEERRRRAKKSKTISLDNQLFHQERRRNRQQEFDDAFGNYDEIDPIDVARRVGGGATSFILDGAATGQVSILHMKNALRTLAGNPLLLDNEVMKRYTYLQQAVAEYNRYPSEGMPKLNADYHFDDFINDTPEWQQKAACIDTPSVNFFPGQGGSTKEAKAVCADCEARDICLEDALSRGDKFGIWGGLSERQRRVVRRVQKSGEATPQEVRVLIATLRGDDSPEENDELDEFDEVFDELYESA